MRESLDWRALKTLSGRPKRSPPTSPVRCRHRRNPPSPRSLPRPRHCRCRAPPSPRHCRSPYSADALTRGARRSPTTWRRRGRTPRDCPRPAPRSAVSEDFPDTTMLLLRRVRVRICDSRPVRNPRSPCRSRQSAGVGDRERDGAASGGMGTGTETAAAVAPSPKAPDMDGDRPTRIGGTRATPR